MSAKVNVISKTHWMADFGGTLCPDADFVMYEYWIRALAFYSIVSLLAPSVDHPFFSL